MHCNDCIVHCGTALFVNHISTQGLVFAPSFWSTVISYEYCGTSLCSQNLKNRDEVSILSAALVYICKLTSQKYSLAKVPKIGAYILTNSHAPKNKRDHRRWYQEISVLANAAARCSTIQLAYFAPETPGHGCKNTWAKCMRTRKTRCLLGAAGFS